MVPTRARILGLVNGWSAGRPSGREARCGSLGESLSHWSSMAGLDEQRQSMVLELYYRKSEGKRESRKRERGRPWPRGEWGEGRERRRAKDESKKGKSLKRAKRGQAAPFIVGWVILQLQGSCGEEHT